MTQAAELALVTVTCSPMWPAELPPGDGSTTALAVVIVHVAPASVGEPVELADEVEEPDDVEVLEVLEVLDVLAVVLGDGVGAGGELLHAARAAAVPAAASTAHTDRTKLTELTGKGP